MFNISEKLGSAYTQLRETASYALISLINCRLPDTDGFLIAFYQFVMEKCKQTIVCVSFRYIKRMSRATAR